MVSNQVLVLLTLVFGFSLSLETVTRNGTEWRYVGIADGKAYMATVNITGTWNQAKQHCLDNQMELASITSPAQYNLIQNAYDSVNFKDLYWTSGRDAMKQRQFSWDRTNEQPSDSIVPITINDGDMRNCLSLYLTSTNLTLHSEACTVATNKVLCEALDFY